MRKWLIYAIWSCEGLDCKSTSHPPTKLACVRYWVSPFLELSEIVTKNYFLARSYWPTRISSCTEMKSSRQQVAHRSLPRWQFQINLRQHGVRNLFCGIVRGGKANSRIAFIAQQRKVPSCYLGYSSWVWQKTNEKTWR